MSTTPMAAASSSSSDPSKLPPDAVLAFLRKHNLKDAEKLFMKEFDVKQDVKTEAGATSSTPSTASAAPGSSSTAPSGGSDHASTMLNSYKSDSDPTIYEDAYQDLVLFVDGSLDLYRHELALILYPVFVHMYLELVYNRHEAAAKTFADRFGKMQESFFQDDIKKLSYITKKQHMVGSELMENFQTSQFTVRMSRDTYSQLRQQKKFLSERKHSILWNIIQEHLYLDVYEGIARNKRQIEATAGGMIGEANRQANRSKVYYGLPREPGNRRFA
jgi:transcription initiation factor TFIID subunit 5